MACLKIPAMKFTHHQPGGGTNDGRISALFYAPATADLPDRVRFTIDHGAGRRTTGFDGTSYWMRRDNFEAFLSRDREDERADIEAIDVARDVCRGLLLPALAVDGGPFAVVTAREEGRDVLRKVDARGRRVTLVCGPDGAPLEVRRCPSGLPGAPPEIEVTVRIADPANVDGVRLPRSVDVLADGQLLLALRLPERDPFVPLDRVPRFR